MTRTARLRLLWYAQVVVFGHRSKQNNVAFLMKFHPGFLGLLMICVPWLARATPVTLDLPVGPAHRIVAAVAKESGLNLKVEDHFAKDILFVRVQDVDVEDVLTKIAEVTAGRWRTQADGTRILGPDPGALNRHEAEFRKKRTEFLRGEMKIFVDETLQQWYKPEIPDYAQGEEYSEDLPLEDSRPDASAFLLAKCVALLNPSVLGTLKECERIVYSTTPTRMQSRLTVSTAAVAEYLARYNKEAKAAMDRMEASPRAQVAYEGLSAEEAKLVEDLFGGERVEYRIQKTPPSKILVILSRDEDWYGGYRARSGVLAELLVLDREGAVIDGHSEYFDTDSRPMDEYYERQREYAHIEQQETRGEKVTDYKSRFPIVSGPVEYSSLSQSLQAFRDQKGVQGAPTAKELEQALADPEANDLLGFHVEDAFRSLGKHSSKNIVAYLEDGIAEFGDYKSVGRLSSTQEFYERVRLKDLQVIRERGSWITMMPPSLEAARVWRVNRAALKTLVTIARGGKTPSLDDLANYAASSPSFWGNRVAAMHLVAANPDFVQIVSHELLNWDVLRAYGLLTGHQRESALRGRPIRLNSLTARQRDAFRSLIYGANFRTKPVRKPSPNDEIYDLFQSVGINSRRKTPATFAGEPTEALPWGIPDEATVTLSSLGDNVYRFPEMEDKSQELSDLGTTGFAFVKVFLDFATDSDSSSVEVKKMFESIRVGTRQTIQVTLHLSDLVGVTEPLIVDSFERASPRVSASQLPQAQLDKIAAAMARLRAHPIIKYMERDAKRESTERVDEGAEPPPPPVRF